MFYQKELDFIISVFNKNQVNTSIINEDSTFSKNLLNCFSDNRVFLRDNISLLKEKQLYKFTDNFMFSYRFLSLPETHKKTALFIGPFLSEPYSVNQVLNIEEINSVSPQQHKFLLEFFSSLPVLAENSPLLIMLDVFCEKIWKSHSFSITDFSKEKSFPDTPFSKTLINADQDSSLIKKEAIERRYAFENKLIRAVSLGQLHLESQFTSAFSSELFEKRASDPLQNAKNYSIIMNTLLRKGAEQGGVHPIYLNEVSSKYAFKIEALNSFSSVPDLMREMFHTYCRLVRKHNLRKFSPVVQKTILLIDSDLSNDLTTKTLSMHQGVSLGYLSAVFKKETGQTISHYVCSRRMDYAEYLLTTSNLQIQTIALHCGIMDAQYFSKLFKRYKGKTPSFFRKNNNHSST